MRRLLLVLLSVLFVLSSASAASAVEAWLCEDACYDWIADGYGSFDQCRCSQPQSFCIRDEGYCGPYALTDDTVPQPVTCTISSITPSADSCWTTGAGTETYCLHPEVSYFGGSGNLYTYFIGGVIRAYGAGVASPGVLYVRSREVTSTTVAVDGISGGSYIDVGVVESHNSACPKAASLVNGPVTPYDDGWSLRSEWGLANGAGARVTLNDPLWPGCDSEKVYEQFHLILESTGSAQFRVASASPINDFVTATISWTCSPSVRPTGCGNGGLAVPEQCEDYSFSTCQAYSGGGINAGDLEADPRQAGEMCSNQCRVAGCCARSGVATTHGPCCSGLVANEFGVCGAPRCGEPNTQGVACAALTGSPVNDVFDGVCTTYDVPGMCCEKGQTYEAGLGCRDTDFCNQLPNPPLCGPEAETPGTPLAAGPYWSDVACIAPVAPGPAQACCQMPGDFNGLTPWYDDAPITTFLFP